MEENQLLRKIVSPALPPALLYREALVRRLNDALCGRVSETQERLPNYKLIGLYAPAGYGKTTLLADLARHTTIPCCWYLLDRTDTDKLVFLKLIIFSIRHCFPTFGSALDQLIESVAIPNVNKPKDSSHFDALVEALITAINTEITERFALFLSNYQEINECPPVVEVVNQLLQKVSEHCIIVIESRVIPDLDFAHLLAYREVYCLSSKELRFTAHEICSLAQIQGVTALNYPEAERLSTSFDGWVMGILLGTRIGDMQFLRTHQGDKQLLFKYVVDEIFKQEAHIYHFLKEASVLQQMTPSLCSKLLMISNAEDHLVYLEKHGLFVTRCDSSLESVYTCHPILRDLLREELKRENYERFILLHRQAADLFLANHDYEQAIYHALESGMEDIAIYLVSNIYQDLFSQGHVDTLTRWIRSFSSTVLATNPLLLLIQANIALLSGDYVLALTLLDAGDQELKQQTPSTVTQSFPPFETTMALARSKALFQAGEYRQSYNLCQIVLAQLSTDDVFSRAEAYMRIGICMNLLGDFFTGIDYLQKALLLWGRHTIKLQVADVHSALASAYSLVGNFSLADHHLSCAIACGNFLHNEQDKVTNLTRMGLLKMRQGKFSEAETFLSDALLLARGLLHFRRGEAYALVNLGELFLDQGQYEQALTYAENGLALAREIKDYYLAGCGLYVLAMIYLLRGDISTALLLASEMEQPKDQENSFSYQRVIYEIICATILFYQQRYEEALASFSKIEEILEFVGLRREHLQVMVRIAACYSAMNRLSMVNTYLKKL